MNDSKNNKNARMNNKGYGSKTQKNGSANNKQWPLHH